MALRNDNPEHILTVEEQRKGGIKSGEVRAEKKTVKKILDDFLSQSVIDYPKVQNVAKKIGISEDKSIKDLFTVVCVLNTLKQGKIDDLTKLSDLLGEKGESENNGILEDLTKFLEKKKNVK